MNKKDLVTAVALSSGLSRGGAALAINCVFYFIMAALRKGDEVHLLGFGTFSVAKRKATTGRNPRTGAVIAIKAANRLRFKAAKGLKDIVGDESLHCSV